MKLGKNKEGEWFKDYEDAEVKIYRCKNRFMTRRWYVNPYFIHRKGGLRNVTLYKGTKSYEDELAMLRIVESD